MLSLPTRQGMPRFLPLNCCRVTDAPPTTHQVGEDTGLCPPALSIARASKGGNREALPGAAAAGADPGPHL